MITKVTTPKGTRFLGITAEANRLEVTREHLWQVLTGRRTSAALMRRVKITEVK